MLNWLRNRFLKTDSAIQERPALDPALMARISALRQRNAQQALYDQIEDLYLSPLRPPSGWSRYATYVSFVLLVAFVVWAALAELDEVTTGIGKVIPSSREQVLQSLEGGMLAELMVKEGDVVDEGQPLLRIDDVKLGANVQESQAKIDALQAAAARWKAELQGGAPQFDRQLQQRSPDVVRSELKTLEARRNALQASLSAQVQAAKLAQDELNITQPLAAKGLVSDIEVLRIQRTLSEARGRINELQGKFRAEASAELAHIEAELGAQNAAMVGRADSFKRTLLKAPKRGVVKNIRVTTLGAVLQSGQDILEIVPIDDTLLIETRIRPADIAFLRPGLAAVVKITAYDSGIYGWLEGELLQISPDTLRDEIKRDELFYKAVVRTHRAELKTPDGRSLPIIPGMQANVDIKTGHKSVLSYLFKPVLRAREALRER